VSNALKYAPGETPVRIRVTGEDGEVVIEVHDEGPGLPAEVRAQLFEPFRRGRAAGADGGLGLGLFIVRTLADAQGARVEVESGAGRGTTFRVGVPRRASGKALAATLRAG